MKTTLLKSFINETLSENDTMKEAVCALIEEGGQYLAVSRKDNPNDFGLIGGKVDPGESPEEALRREATEEAGILLKKFFLVFEDICGPGKDGKSYFVKTYKVIDWEDLGTGTDESGVVAWVTKEKLISGSFGEYNRSLFRKLGV